MRLYCSEATDSHHVAAALEHEPHAGGHQPQPALRWRRGGWLGVQQGLGGGRRLQEGRQAAAQRLRLSGPPLQGTTTTYLLS